MEWRLFCENKQRPRLMFVRESDPGATAPVTVALMTGSEKSLAFGRYPAHSGKYDVWSESLTPDMIKAVLDSPKLQMGEGTASPDGKTSMSIVDIDNSGLQEAWAQLLTQCSSKTPAPAQARSTVTWPPSQQTAVWPPASPAVSSPAVTPGAALPEGGSGAAE